MRFAARGMLDPAAPPGQAREPATFSQKRRLMESLPMLTTRPLVVLLSFLPGFLLSGGAPSSSAVPRAAEIVARWREAVHAKAAAADAYAVVTTTSDQDGIEGRIE